MNDERTPKDMGRRDMLLCGTALAAAAGLAASVPIRSAQAQNAAPATGRRPNIVMLMTDDTGWNDFGCYSGGGTILGHPTSNTDRMAKEGPSLRVGTLRQAAPPAAPCS